MAIPEEPDDPLYAECPGCALLVSVEREQFGHELTCPRCQQAFAATSLRFLSDEDRQRAEWLLLELELRSYDESGEPRAGAREDTTGVSTRHIGRFELRDELGGGAFGVVHRAYDTFLRREVALKLPRSLGGDERTMRRFITEARSAAKLRHPNIVGVFDSGQTEGVWYIASELVSGRPLSAYAKGETGPLDLRTKVEWAHQLAEALAYAHEEDVVHRDIKPDNVLIDDEHRRPQITDFGLAKQTDQNDSLRTHDGALLGTPAYMAPEQARCDQKSVGPHSDQFSLGMVVFELLTGTRPFQGDRLGLLAEIASMAPTPSIRSVAPSIPRDVAAIVDKTLRKDPAHRYRSCDDLAEDLSRWLRGESVSARPLGPVGRMQQWAKRRPLVAGLASTLLLMGVSASVVVAVALRSTIEARRLAEASKSEALVARDEAERQRENADEQRQEAEEVARRLREERTRTEQAQAQTAKERSAKQEAVEELGSLKTEVAELERVREQLDSAVASKQAELATTQDRLIALDSEFSGRLVKLKKQIEERYADPRTRYRKLIVLADAAIREEQIPDAGAVLAACPESERAWEWEVMSRGVEAESAWQDFLEHHRGRRREQGGPPKPEHVALSRELRRFEISTRSRKGEAEVLAAFRKRHFSTVGSTFGQSQHFVPSSIGLRGSYAISPRGRVVVQLSRQRGMKVLPKGVKYFPQVMLVANDLQQTRTLRRDLSLEEMVGLRNAPVRWDRLVAAYVNDDCQFMALVHGDQKTGQVKSWSLIGLLGDQRPRTANTVWQLTATNKVTCLHYSMVGSNEQLRFAFVSGGKQLLVIEDHGQCRVFPCVDRTTAMTTFNPLNVADDFYRGKVVSDVCEVGQYLALIAIETRGDEAGREYLVTWKRDGSPHIDGTPVRVLPISNRTMAAPQEGVLKRSEYRLTPHPLGEVIAVSSRNETVFFDCREGTTLGRIAEMAFAFSPSGDRALCHDRSDQQVRLWSLASQEFLPRLALFDDLMQPITDALRGEGSVATRVRYDPTNATCHWVDVRSLRPAVREGVSEAFSAADVAMGSLFLDPIRLGGR